MGYGAPGVVAPLVDREEVCREAIEERGIPFRPVFTLKEILGSG